MTVAVIILQLSLLWSPNAVKCFLGLTTHVYDLFNILCVCICVCTCPCVCGCTCMGVEAKGQHWISSPITLRLIFWDRVSIEPEAHPCEAGWPVSSESVCVCALPTLGFQMRLPQPLHGCWVSEFTSSCLHGEHFADWATALIQTY